MTKLILVEFSPHSFLVSVPFAFWVVVGVLVALAVVTVWEVTR